MSDRVPVRLDGRSDRRVVADLVKAAGAQPDQIFTYEQIEAAIREGREGAELVTRDLIYQVVALAVKLLEAEEGRTLQNLRGIGYRVAHANEHVDLAGGRRRRAERQMARGQHTLENLHMEELTGDEKMTVAESRMLHVVQLRLIGLTNARIDRTNEVVATLIDLPERVANLERQQQQQQQAAEQQRTAAEARRKARQAAVDALR